MKGWVGLVVAVAGLVETHNLYRFEIETAFVQFDLDSNGVVTKDEMVQSVMRDTEREKYSEEHRKEMLEAINAMIDNFDRDHNGLDFLEMYEASGGNLEEL